MSNQSDTFGVGSILTHVALHGFPGMTVEDDDPLYQRLRTGLYKENQEYSLLLIYG